MTLISGGSSGGGTSNEVPQNPCIYAGSNLAPRAWAAIGNDTKNNPITTTLDLYKGFAIGGYLDAQPLAMGSVYEKAAYGNSGFPLSVTLAGANGIAYLHKRQNPTQYSNRVMDTKYPSLPANVVNITNGYNAQKNGALCTKPSPLPPPPPPPFPNGETRQRSARIEGNLNGANMGLTDNPGTRVGSWIRRATSLLIFGVCVSLDGPKTTWSAESRSPDGKMIARARTIQQWDRNRRPWDLCGPQLDHGFTVSDFRDLKWDEHEFCSATTATLARHGDHTLLGTFAR